MLHHRAMSNSDRPIRRRKAIGGTVAAAGAVLALLAALVFGPGWLIALDLQGQTIKPAERLDAVNKVRTTMLQAVGGLVLSIGAYATWRRLRINEEELRTSRDGQITERYSRAIEHLGNEHLEVRIGGIYALERVARNSAVDCDAIIALLCAYVRSHAPWPPLSAGSELEDTGPDEIRSLAARANDVQSAVVTLSRLQPFRQDQQVALPRTDLRFGRFSGLHLHDVRMDNANLSRVRLRGSDLRRSILLGCDLRLAQLQGADFRDTRLEDSDLRDADLRGTDLRGANLDGSRLGGAHADSETQWPIGFDPVEAGVSIASPPATP